VNTKGNGDTNPNRFLRDVVRGDGRDDRQHPQHREKNGNKWTKTHASNRNAVLRGSVPGVRLQTLIAYPIAHCSIPKERRCGTEEELDAWQ
jgi:hypothetical protein